VVWAAPCVAPPSASQLPRPCPAHGHPSSCGCEPAQPGSPWCGCACEQHEVRQVLSRLNFVLSVIGITVRHTYMVAKGMCGEWGSPEPKFWHPKCMSVVHGLSLSITYCPGIHGCKCAHWCIHQWCICRSKYKGWWQPSGLKTQATPHLCA
jgi:hypothetical protein